MSVDQSTVEYRELEEFPGYRFGSDGSVWSVYRAGNGGNKPRPWRRLNGTVNRFGYLVVKLKSSGKRHPYQAHRLILKAFRGAAPVGLVCCHGDGNKLNNVLTNLRWDTPKANAADRDRHGTSTRGQANVRAKLTDDAVKKMRKEYVDGLFTQTELAKRYNVSQATTNGVVLRKIWKHVA